MKLTKLYFILLACMLTACTIKVDPFEIKEISRTPPTLSYSSIPHINMESNVPNSGFGFASSIISKAFGVAAFMYTSFFVIIALVIIFILISAKKRRDANLKLLEKIVEGGHEIPEPVLKTLNRDNDLYSKGIKNICLGTGLGLALSVIIDWHLAFVGIAFIIMGLGQLFLSKKDGKQ